MKRSELKFSGFFLVHNTGNNRKKVFYSNDDFNRFLKSAMLFQFTGAVQNMHRIFRKKELPKPKTDRLLKIVAFNLSAYGFKLVLHQNEAERISKYMQRLMTSYTKYYNERYLHEGALFRGAYKLSKVPDELINLQLKEMHSNMHEFSSFIDYSDHNRWPHHFQRYI